MTKHFFKNPLDDEISIKDIFDFFLDCYKLISGIGVLGLLGAVYYLSATPNLYEATAQIQMAQISANNTTNPLGVNVEEPSLLIARLKLPSNYSSIEIKACSLEQESMPTETLVKMSKFSTVKNVSSLVELKIRMESKDQAIVCAQALFDSIRESQNQILKPYIEAAKTLEAKYQNRLKETQALVSRVDKSGGALSAAYLTTRDEIRFLSDESVRLNALIAAGDARQTKLVSPIYASEVPVFPQKTLVLIIGLFVGLFLGVLIGVAKRKISGCGAQNLQ